jgi:hypothetical protein
MPCHTILLDIFRVWHYFAPQKYLAEKVFRSILPNRELRHLTTKLTGHKQPLPLKQLTLCSGAAQLLDRFIATLPLMIMISKEDFRD